MSLSESEHLTRTKETIGRIAANDPYLTEVRLFYFGENDLGDSEAVQIAAALRVNTHVVTLNLFISIGPVGAAALAKTLSNNFTLTTLNLGGNKIGPVGAAALAKTLSNNFTLTTLNLGSNKIGPNGAIALAGMLSNNSTLTKLDLDTNKIGPNGAIALAGMLSDNSTLTKINLYRNKIGPNGARALAGMLSDNSTLTEINLNTNNIGPNGARALAGMLSDNSTLTTLYLSSNHFGDAGATVLADALRTNSTLTSLNLRRNKITDSIRKKIIKLIRINAYACSREEARCLKTKLCIEWMVDAREGDEAGAQYEEAVALTLEEMGFFPEPEYRRELFHTLLGSTEHGEDVAASVETVPRGRALCLYSADCGAAPAVLMKILRAHPSLCGTCRDVEHKLYPFMLLATLPDAEAGDVMELLLQCPSLVASGIGEPIGRGKSK
eukprot:CAMPEP_0113589364 /NCGR_PEP_ID=MMETSP0015_2-20120614/36046_1 /TAXON_ID=2838 /ORGANISM="Odontella" /LENGTH=438 /DNA_ID=CAMNT_0000495373 /DNA_START=378 /DNA_END=1694 /DNA_ORIENTATION=- /assembly_acc=CAM_ASM_000160